MRNYGLVFLSRIRFPVVLGVLAGRVLARVLLSFFSPTSNVNAWYAMQELIYKYVLIKWRREWQGLGDEENKNGVLGNKAFSLSLLKDCELLEMGGGTSWTGEWGGGSGSCPRILKKLRRSRAGGLPGCAILSEHDGLFGGLAQTQLQSRLCNHDAGRSWENPTKWNRICLWLSWDSKFGQWNLVGKCEMHKGLYGEPKIYRYGK